MPRHREFIPQDCSSTWWPVAMTAEDFSQESDYQAFIERLRTVRERYPFFLYAYVLMSNHFHLTPLPAGASVAVLKLRLLTAPCHLLRGSNLLGCHF